MIISIARLMILMLVMAALITACEVVEGGRTTGTSAPLPETPVVSPVSATAVPSVLATPASDAPYPYPAP